MKGELLMFICPYYAYRNFHRMPDVSSISHIRFLNASPNSPAIDVYLNDRLIFRNLLYKYFSDYVSIPSGTYHIKVFPSGSTTNPLIDKSLFIPPERIFTLAAIDDYPNINLLSIEDVRRPRIPDKAFIRFAHLSPEAPTLNIVLPDGNTLFSNISYKQVTRYLPVDPGTYTIEARTSDSGERILYVPNIRLRPDKFYTIYAVGNVSKPPKLQVLIPLDGNSYIQF